VGSVTCALALLLVAVASYGEDALLHFSIPAQPLASGLLQLGRQANISIAFDHALVAKKSGAALEGEMDVNTALTRMLQATGLTFELVRPNLAHIIATLAPRIAQPARPAPAQVSVAQNETEEVTVTARRRPESSELVPISMSVLHGDELAAANLNDIADISSRIPSLEVRPNPSEKDRSIFIRGLGTITTSQSPDPSVATVIDGVVMAHSGQAMADILDLDQIEVLNGPQGTLFGKNASAGVLNITTHNPTPYLSGFARVAYYEGNEYRVTAGISGPLSENVAGRIAAFDGGYDGNMKNLYNGQEVDGYRHSGVRGKLVAAPTEALKLTFAADLTRSSEDVPGGAFTSSGQYVYCPRYLIAPPAPNPCIPNQFYPNPPLAAQLAALGVHPSASNSAISNDSANNTFDSNGGASLQADWRLGADYLLTSISAWRQWSNTLEDYDYDQFAISDPNYPRIIDNGQVASTQTSQELRLTSPRGRYVDFVAGLYYMHTDNHERYSRTDTLFISSAETLPVGYGVNHFGETSTNYAVFGEMNFNLAPRLRAFLGYREIWDQVSYFTDRVVNSTLSPLIVPAVAPDFAGSGSHGAQGWAGRTGLQWSLSPDVMAYTTVSRGYKGPAYNVFFNVQAVNTTPVNPERSDAYEIGVKSWIWNHRIRLDAAAFDTQIHDYQAALTQQVGGTLVTNLVNAGGAVSRGFELSLAATPTSRLTYRLEGQFDNASVGDFVCHPVLLQCSLSGNMLPYAPRWRVDASQDYRYPLTHTLDLDANVAYRWQSLMDFQFINTPDLTQPSYGIWDLSVGLRDVADRWSTWLVVKNVLDKDYSSYKAQGDLGGVLRWVPRDAHRYVGINAQLDF
jgi:iron complex outermembrane recepter protein